MIIGELPLPPAYNHLASLTSPNRNVVILTVGPFGTPSAQVDAMLREDEYYFHFSQTTLRSCYRSCISQANEAKLRALAISPLTTCSTNDSINQEILRLGLQTLVEEVKFSQ